MRKYRRILSILFLSLLLAGLIVAPTLAQDETPPGSAEQPAQPAVPAAVPEASPQVGNTIIYNLYATDGFVTMADGTQQYIYGFIGGRQGVPLTYLNAAGAAVTINTGAPAPTGGPIVVGTESLLAGNAQFPRRSSTPRWATWWRSGSRTWRHPAVRTQRPAHHPPARSGRACRQRRRP